MVFGEVLNISLNGGYTIYQWKLVSYKDRQTDEIFIG